MYVSEGAMMIPELWCDRARLDLGSIPEHDA